MPSSADRVIAVLRSRHDALADLVAGLSADDLARPTGASEWDVSQVLSHMGSGAEISLAILEASITGTEAPGGDFNRSVWARWDGATREERAANVIPANEALVKRYESLTDDERETVRVTYGWMPAPVDIRASATMRLSEFALHSWDVAVAFDPAATVAPDAAPLLLDQLGFMIGSLAKPDRLDGKSAALAVELTDADTRFGLVLGPDAATGDVPATPDGTLRLPTESWLRLVSGRLKPPYVPSSVSVDGPLSLDDLHRVFPGF